MFQRFLSLLPPTPGPGIAMPSQYQPGAMPPHPTVVTADAIVTWMNWFLDLPSVALVIVVVLGIGLGGFAFQTLARAFGR